MSPDTSKHEEPRETAGVCIGWIGRGKGEGAL